MNIPPDAAKSITDRIISKNRATCLSRANELSAEGRLLREQAKELTARLALYCGKVSAFILEMRKDEDSTVKLPTLPER